MCVPPLTWGTLVRVALENKLKDKITFGELLRQALLSMPQDQVFDYVDGRVGAGPVLVMYSSVSLQGLRRGMRFEASSYAADVSSGV